MCPIDLSYLENIIKERGLTGIQIFPKENHNKQQHNRFWVVMKDGVSITEPVKQRSLALQSLENTSMDFPGSRLAIMPFIFHKQVDCSSCKYKGKFLKIVGNHLIYKCDTGHITKVDKTN